MAQSCSLSLLEALCTVPDPRSPLGRRHPLAGVLALLSVAAICGCRSVYAALQFGRDRCQELAHKLGLAKHGIPTDGMMSTLLRRLDLVAFERALEQWAATAFAAAGAEPGAAEPQQIALDGKTLRGSQGHAIPGVHLLAAYAVRLGIVIKQVPAGANKDEGGEIAAALRLLEGLVFQGKLITGDAIHTQRQLCGKIIEGQGDYLLPVKENQPSMLLEVQDLFRSPCAPFLPTAKPTSTARGSRSGQFGRAGNWPDGATGRG
jgi:hypothetical protein